MLMSARFHLSRFAWQACGAAALITGIIGIILPLLPTTPFVLLAAFCFARGSERVHDWLLTHPRFGPMIEDWRRNGAISRKAKIMAGAAMAAALLISVLIDVPGYALAAQAVVMVFVGLFIFTRPDH